MRTILSFIFVAFFCVNNIFAQDKNTTQPEILAQIDSLSSKLNSLQHDYDYLYCSHEINLLHLELKDQINNIDIKSNAVLINCYHSRFDIDLYTAYRDNYNSSLDLYNSMKEKNDAVQGAVALKIYSSNFTKSEVAVLMNGCEFLNKCLTKLKGSLDYYKVVLDMYKDLR